MPEVKVKPPLREFGNGILVTTVPGIYPSPEELPEMITSRVNSNMDASLSPFKWIKKVEWEVEPDIVLGPVDVLGRFQSVGWYAAFRSEGYEELSRYFACRRQHAKPITFKAAMARFWEWMFHG